MFAECSGAVYCYLFFNEWFLYTIVTDTDTYVSIIKEISLSWVEKNPSKVDRD